MQFKVQKLHFEILTETYQIKRHQSCIEVMSRLIMKYGLGLLEKMDQERLRSLISAEIESSVNKDRFSACMLGYCKLMTDRK